MSETTKIYELKISLSGIKPTIYRTIQIEENRTFFELQAAIQIAFGWEILTCMFLKLVTIE